MQIPLHSVLCHTKKPNDDIKIFVSHRMDLDSAVIGNRIFENYKCNAGSARCFLKMNGDDTGDNISDLAKYFSELRCSVLGVEECRCKLLRPLPLQTLSFIQQ